MKTIFLLLAVVVLAGCIQQDEYVPLTELHLQGGGNEVYTFTHDIRQTLKLNVNNPEGIMDLADRSDIMVLVFDGSDRQDNAYFTVVVTNLQQKIPIYYAYKDRVFNLVPFYYLGDEWFDKTGKNITKPDFGTTPAIWLKGPSTGATDTSLNLTNNTIYLSGLSYQNLTMAGDRLTLLFFNIDEISDIEGA